MARKDLLKGLMEPPPEQSDTGAARVDTGRPRYSGGAIGAVSQSIAGLKSRSVLEIDPHEVAAGGLQDRLDHDEAGHRALMESIREHGQQVPVLLRPHPDTPGRYQVVYGRRRVLALRDLGLPVKALVRDLDDRELILAQGQENAARRDLSFIEKANFARQMRDHGYDRATICAALHVDKTVISRMLSVVDRLPVDLIEVIGAAPSVGRDRWLAVAEWIEADVFSAEEAIAVVNLTAGSDGSDTRFEALHRALTHVTGGGRTRKTQTAPREPPRALEGGDGTALGKAARRRGATVLHLSDKAAPGFADWLIRTLPEIHQRWKDGDGD
ncbi:plasmid partitioning protein RepB [Roseovarius ramblicola]|uniref:Plasmid partitioning protein RepB n=1 Tax=Roseovarius ramblicola TaxID=2022336 RepID=A0ABV5I3N8_9RHOB